MTRTPERKAEQSGTGNIGSSPKERRLLRERLLVSSNAIKGGHRPYMRQLARELSEECEYTQRIVEICRDAYFLKPVGTQTA